MNLHAVISVVAMLAYLGLVVASLQRSEHQALPRRLFATYLGIMLVQQALYLVVSLASTVSVARLAYYGLLAFVTLPWLVYYLFARAMFEKSHGTVALATGLGTLVIMGISLRFASPHIYASFITDEQTGLIVPTLGPLMALPGVVTFGLAGLTIVELAKVLRSSSQKHERRRAQYLVLGLVLVLLGQVANASEALRPYPIDVIANLTTAILIGYAMSRNELIELPFAAREALIRSAPTALLFILWFTLLRLLGPLENFESLLLSLVAASLSTLAAWTLGERLRIWLERLLFPEHYRLTGMVQRVSERARTELDLDRLANLIVDDLVEALEARWAGLFLKGTSDSKWRLAAGRLRLEKDDGFNPEVILEELESRPELLAATTAEHIVRHSEKNGLLDFVIVPLRIRGKLLGLYGIFPSQPGRPSQDVISALQSLADQTSAALDNARLHENLRHQLVERERLQENLVHMQKMEAMGTLASGVAHDMNNLLGAIMSVASAATEDARAQRPVEAKDLEHIIEACRRGRDLTDALLGFAKQRAVTRTSVDMNDVVENVATLLERTVSKDIHITTELSQDESFVEADRSQLDTVMMNVCLNAVAAIGERGNLRLVVDAVLRESKNESPHKKQFIRVRVIDDGIGMDEDTIRQAFDPFFTTRSDRGGTGLGLSMVYGIIRSHDGLVTLESEKRRGTTISILLPALRRGSSAKRPSRQHKSAELPPLRILLVDDENLVRRAGRRVLSQLGCHVKEAVSGAEAVTYFEKHADEVDVVILDMIMPGMDGEETFLALREINQDLLILLCSGFTNEEKVERLLKRGRVGFLSKPFDVQTLRHEIQTLLESGTSSFRPS